MAPKLRASRVVTRATRSKPKISYAEDSDSEVDQLEYSESESDHAPNTSRPRTRTSRSRPITTPHKRSIRSRHEPGGSSHKRASKRQRLESVSPKKAAAVETSSIQYSGVVPAWESLPYLVLLRIFKFASFPLYDENNFQPLPSSRWLLDVGLMCKLFSEPALTLLYTTPPLVPMVHAHRLVELLDADPRSLSFKYRQKVISLRIDVGQVAMYSLQGSGHLDLHKLIKHLPLLKELEFYHQKDMSPYRDLDSNIKWTYPESLFEALEFVDPQADPMEGDKTGVCRLQSWRWSSRLAGKQWSIDKIREIHLKPSFISLRKIAFTNYQVPLLKKDEEDPKHENILADALHALPDLEHVIFESSTLVNSKLLPLLPTGLRTLELINCWEVVANDLASFLASHGSKLHTLILNHNQSLSLSFLETLALACPKLQVLRMNLTYFNLHATYRDSEPQYEHLLLPTEVPKWPPTLQTIELIQLRKWEIPAAEMFFQSLLDSAGSLQDLRKLSIQAIINIGWRDRASFRDKWVGSLDRVFKRISDPPMELSTCRTFAAPPLTLTDRPKVQEPTDEATTNIQRSSRRSAGSSDNSEAAMSGEPSTRRRSARSSVQKVESGKYAETDDDSDDEPLAPSQISPHKAARRNRFQRELEVLAQTAGHDSPALTTSAHQTSTEESSDDDAPLFNGKGKVAKKVNKQEVIQGMCGIVEVRIDNLRPTETQVTEADFLDSERSGDDDWNGDDDADDGYAW